MTTEYERVPFIVPPEGVYSKERGFRPVCQSVSLPSVSHSLDIPASFSFPLYYYYYYGAAALYNPRNKSYLSPETNYHYGNSLLNPTNERTNERTKKPKRSVRLVSLSLCPFSLLSSSSSSANAMIRFPRQLCGACVCLSIELQSTNL